MDETKKMLIQICLDLESIKTDVTWLKRLFGTIVVVTAAVFGIDATGVVV